MKNEKINILLVMPKIDIGLQGWPVPPIGIAYVSAALKEKGFPVYNVNLNLETDSMYTVLERAIKKYDIDLVATGGLIVNYHTVKEIMDVSKKIKPEVITYIGGSLVTFSAEAVMRGIQSADIGMIGEGEITACELAQVLSERGGIDRLKNVKGLIVRMDNGELYTTLPREEIPDIDRLPWPDYEGFRYFEMIRKEWNSDATGIVSVPLTTSRSCPFRCTFCSKSGGEKYRQRSLDNIFAELDYLVEKYGVNRIMLNDELFANDRDRIQEFCKRIKEYEVKWFVSLRVSKYITEELLELMRDSGCIQILYGLESGDNNVLRSMRKGITTEEMERVVRLTAGAGFQVRGSFIFGDPVETLETVHNTIAFIEKNKDVFSAVALSPIILFPGSELYKKALVDGTIEDELKFIEEECPIKNVSKMSDDEYFQMVNEILPKAKVKLNMGENDKAIQNLYIDASVKEYWFEHRCPDCGGKNRFYISNAEIALMRTNPYICESCGKMINISVTKEFAQMFYSYLKKICQQYRVALWGCGQNMVVLSEYVEAINDLKFWFLDSDLMKIGKEGIGGKKIYEPEAITDLNIDFIIAMSTGRHKEIINRVNREFPEVKYAYSMFDMPLYSAEYLIE